MTAQYHRKANSRTQNISTTKKQFRSGELWGQPHRRGGMFPSVKAYVGPLPDGQEGIEFEVDIEPVRISLQGVVCWRPPEHSDVLSFPSVAADVADICSLKVGLTKSCYDCKKT